MTTHQPPFPGPVPRQPKPFRSPQWRRAHDGPRFDADLASGRRLFHAFDAHDNAVCSPGFGLADGDRPTEADLANLCPEYVGVRSS